MVIGFGSRHRVQGRIRKRRGYPIHDRVPGLGDDGAVKLAVEIVVVVVVLRVDVKIEVPTREGLDAGAGAVDVVILDYVDERLSRRIAKNVSATGPPVVNDVVDEFVDALHLRIACGIVDIEASD